MNRRGAQGVDMVKVMENPRYRGKHIIVMGGEVYTATSGENARKRLRQLEKKYPNQIPAITYVPKVDTLILWL